MCEQSRRKSIQMSVQTTTGELAVVSADTWEVDRLAGRHNYKAGLLEVLGYGEAGSKVER